MSGGGTGVGRHRRRPWGPALLLGALLAAGGWSAPTAPGTTARAGERPPTTHPGTPQDDAALPVPALPDDVELAGAILELEDGGHPADVADLLDHADARVRVAALAAGRGCSPDRHATLVARLGDEEPAVRAAAAFALGLLRFETDPELATARRERAATAVASHLPERPEVALASSLALGELRVAAAAPALAELLGRGPEVAPGVAAAALWAHGRTPGATATPTLAWLEHADARVRLAAAGAVVAVGDPNALPALTRLLDDPEPAVRAAAVGGLAERAPPLLQRRLDDLLEERAPEVLVAVLRYLRQAWDPDEVPAGRLGQVLRHSLDRDLHVRRAALATLGPAAPRSGAAADRLLQALEEPEPAVRASALRALSAAGGDAADRGLQWAYGRWRESPSPEAGVHGVEAAALAAVLARSGRDRDLEWLRELAEAADDRLWKAAYPRLVEVDPEAAMGLTRRWLPGPGNERTAWALWGALRLYRSHGLPPEPQRPALVDDVWGALRGTSSRGEAPVREMALQLLAGLAPELLDRRLEYLAGLPWPDLRLTVQRLGRPWPGSGSLAAADPGEYRRAAQRVLAVGARQPTLLLSSERGDATVRVFPDAAPLAVLDVLERAARPGGLELTVDAWSPADGVVGLGADDWPRQPGWPRAAVPALAAPGLLVRERHSGPPGSGTWAVLAGPSPGPAGEAWGRVREGLHRLARLQPGDRVRIERIQEAGIR